MPSKPGIYRFLDENNTILYVGKAKDLKARVSTYFTSRSNLGPKTEAMVAQIKKIDVVVVESELESLLLEAFYIKKHRPYYNIRLTDDKSYPLIKITSETYPVVSLARKMDEKSAKYFGPYPNSGAVKLVLTTLRKVFPYQSVKNHPKKTCLYFHLGLCPCPPVHDSLELKKEYRSNIHNIIKVLDGKSQAVMKDLVKEMNESVSGEYYEKAAVLKKKIQALSIITMPSRSPVEYDLNPNLRSDIRSEELSNLKSSLTKKGLKLSDLSRIECYDISNTQGTHATGSMVVLTNGEIDKSQYRRFNIVKDGRPNDFAMMKEMLLRRQKHNEWPTPQLIIIDGGKGQASAALEVLTATKSSIPIVGLAKREEILIIPKDQPHFSSLLVEKTHERRFYGQNDEHFLELHLLKNSPELQLVRRIRDEAHRFAITYHRKLRSKNFIKS
ncbi:MAG: GIY-YIG nuclease family protein [Candidatus Levybacteria bacterium]|nr:GIY-YIG nuclease family protein [Candidatus Levybacteria bacterium]